MRKLSLVFLVLILIIQAKGQPYKDPKVPVEDRVKDLLSRMTQEEKFWQMFMIPGDLSKDKEKYKTGIFGFQGSTVGQNGNAAGQMLSYAAGASTIETAEMVNEMQHFFIAKSRLGFPIIPFDANDFLTAWLLKESGSKSERDQVMKDLLGKNPLSKSVQWCNSMYTGNFEKAKIIAAEVDRNDQTSFCLVRIFSEALNIGSSSHKK